VNRNEQSAESVIALTILTAPACTRVKVAEISLDNTVFGEAKRIEDPKPATEFVTVPEPLPLPGQLKAPKPESDTEPEAIEDTATPETRIDEANQAAKIEPVKDGYINAIQVYPFTVGALYQLRSADAGVRHRA